MLLDLDNLSGATNHNGGAIHFGPDGKLYIAVGENANSSNSQSINNRLGKMLRINSDGTIPADNPTTFPNIVGSPTGNNRAIWAVGLRNPFTFSFQQGTGRMHINDVGEGTWEEVNLGNCRSELRLGRRLRRRLRRCRHDESHLSILVSYRLGVRDHGRRFLQSDHGDIPRRVSRQVFLSRLLRWLDENN